MKRTLFTALVLVAGCERSAAMSQTPVEQACPATGDSPPLSETDTPALIEAGAAASPRSGAYLITTNGMSDWSISWQGDAQSHTLTGEIYCPKRCKFDPASIQFANALSSDHVHSIADNHIGFDATTTPDALKQLQLSTISAGCPEDPLTFDLQIDGRPAINPFVFFPWGGRLESTSRMPFSLVDLLKAQ